MNMTNVKHFMNMCVIHIVQSFTELCLLGTIFFLIAVINKLSIPFNNKRTLHAGDPHETSPYLSIRITNQLTDF